MKKTFYLKVENRNQERQLEAIKYDIKKYIAREKRKKLLEKSDFWLFDCKIGVSEDSASDIHISKINKWLNDLIPNKINSFYVEILAKPGFKIKKEKL